MNSACYMRTEKENVNIWKVSNLLLFHTYLLMHADCLRNHEAPLSLAFKHYQFSCRQKVLCLQTF